MSRGGPRPGAGRKPYADPSTADEAARMLATYTDGGIWPSAHGDVQVSLSAAVELLHRLRRRSPAKVSAKGRGRGDTAR